MGARPVRDDRAAARTPIRWKHLASEDDGDRAGSARVARIDAPRKRTDHPAQPVQGSPPPCPTVSGISTRRSASWTARNPPTKECIDNKRRERHMTMQRRHLAGLGLALAVAAVGTAHAASADETAVMKNTMAHRDALFAADAKGLDKLTAPELSYSHSDGHIEDKATMIANATNGKSKWLSLTYQNPTVRIVHDAAIVRFNFVGQNQSGDKTNDIKLGILMVWQKQAGQWKLLARCSTKL
jgi:hypothetical protein